MFGLSWFTQTSQYTEGDLEKMFAAMLEIVPDRSVAATYQRDIQEAFAAPGRSGRPALVRIYNTLEQYLLTQGGVSERRHLHEHILTRVSLDRIPAWFNLLLFPGTMQQELQAYLLAISMLEEKLAAGKSKEKTLAIIGGIYQKLGLAEGLNTEAPTDTRKLLLFLTKKPIIVSTCQRLYEALYIELRRMHGDEAALEAVRHGFTFFKETYPPTVMGEYMRILPRGVLELERLAFMSHSELERQVSDRTRELKELNETLELRVAERTKDLSAANTRLEELDKVKNEFISIAAHQLRTPATKIKWLLETLLDAPETKIQEVSGDIRDASRFAATLIGLVNSLLDLSRIENGSEFVMPSIDSYAALAREVCADMQSIAEGKKIVYSWTITDNIPNTSLDKSKLSIVLVNLIDNAIKYTPEGGTVAVSVVLENNTIITRVQDSGIGIDAVEAHRLFTKFYRAQEAKARHTDGTGIGLYIAKKIVELHGGTIGFTSEHGKGTLFTVTLPATTPAAA